MNQSIHSFEHLFFISLQTLLLTNSIFLTFDLLELETSVSPSILFPSFYFLNFFDAVNAGYRNSTMAHAVLWVSRVANNIF